MSGQANYAILQQVAKEEGFKDNFNSINSEINNKYYLFHIDEKSNSLNSKQFNSYSSRLFC